MSELVGLYNCFRFVTFLIFTFELYIHIDRHAEEVSFNVNFHTVFSVQQINKVVISVIARLIACMHLVNSTNQLRPFMLC